MKKNLLIGLAFGLILIFVVGYMGADAGGIQQTSATPIPGSAPQATEPLRTIKVSGNAQVMVVPDEVVLTLGIETWHAKLSIAKTNNDQVVKNVVGVTKEFNIPEKYVQTDYLNVQPSFENYEHHVLTGYYVRRNVVITLKDLTQFESLLSSVLEAGVNYVHGIDFRTSELRKYRDQARELALQAAKEKAVAMSGKLEQQIGEPLSIEEASFYWYSPYSSYWSYGGGGGIAQNVVQNAPSAGSTDLSQIDEAMEPGQIAVGATVNVEFVLQ